MKVKDKNENDLILNIIDVETVEKLAEIVSKNDLGEIRIDSDEYGSVTIKGKKSVPVMPSVMSAGVSAPVAQQDNSAVPVAEKSEDVGNAIKSPIVGTFYSAPSPDKPPFVKVGDRVKKGDVVMIIESMKLMNEIQSEYDGVVAKILVSDGQAVEYDQPIMIIK